MKSGTKKAVVSSEELFLKTPTLPLQPSSKSFQALLGAGASLHHNGDLTFCRTFPPCILSWGKGTVQRKVTESSSNKEREYFQFYSKFLALSYYKLEADTAGPASGRRLEERTSSSLF